jgi:hypothetical protein
MMRAETGVGAAPRLTRLTQRSSRLKNPTATDRERGITAPFGACRAGCHVFCTRLATIIERQTLLQALEFYQYACMIGSDY